MKFTNFLIALTATVLSTSNANAQTYPATYPAKPVRLIVGFPSGGGTDTLARVLSRKLGDSWPQPLVIENRAGADGAITAEIVAKAPADGYTLAMISNAHTITPFLRKLAYYPVRDFAPVTIVASNPNLLLMHPSLPVANVKQLVALARARPNELIFGSSGSGTSPYLAMELLKSMTDMQLVHVPYKGSSPAVIDLMGGHIQLMFGAVSTGLPHLQSGRLRALGISSLQRTNALPQIPTIAESGVPGFEVIGWFGILAPANTQPAIVAKLQTDIAAAISAPEIHKHLTDNGYSPVLNKPQAFGDVIRIDMARWGKLIRSLEPQK